MKPRVKVTIRQVGGEPREMADLQRVMEGAPRYAQIATGVPPGSADAQSLYTMLPDGKSYTDKFVYGIHCDGSMVGCADVIRGFPDAATAHIGLVLIIEAVQGRGIGRASYRAIERIMRSWDGCRRVRIGVLRTNEGALAFWKKQGFGQSGDARPYRHGPVATDALILTKPLG